MSQQQRGVTVTVALTTGAATAVLLASALRLDHSSAHEWAVVGLVFFGLFVLSELFPIQLVGRPDGGEMTASATFGFALLLTVPVEAALLAIALGTLLGDALAGGRKAWIRTVFNVAQVTLSFAAAAAIIGAVRGATYTAVTGVLSFDDLWALIPAGIVMYLVNILLITLVMSQDQSAPFLAVLRSDVAPFDMLTHLLQIAFAPAFVVLWVHAPLLSPFIVLAALSTYRATRKAVEGQHESRHDALTGLPNRRLLDERLTELAQTAREEGTFAVTAMDLDGFKTVNDAFGHEIGDLLLIEAAQRLRRAPGVDTAVRTGGDEFAAIIREGLGHPELRRTGECLVALLTEPYVIRGLPLQVGASLGIARHRRGEDVRALLARADDAMYEAKRAGGGVRSARRDHGTIGPGRLSLVSDLEAALEEGQLRLDYQPQFSLQTDGVVGLEALLRWDHPRHGTIGPGSFVGPAEHTELLPALTRYVLERVLADHVERQRSGTVLPVAANISARDLLDRRLPRDLADLLTRYDVRPGELTLEMTESALLVDPRRATPVLRQLLDIGVGLSVDDFGTGYASLEILRDQPFTELKIDRSFVRAMHENVQGDHIIRAIIELSRNLQLRVVAEGIERPRELEHLVRYGCQVGQGYLLARPLNTPGLTSFLQEAALRVGDGHTPTPLPLQLHQEAVP